MPMKILTVEIVDGNAQVNLEVGDGIPLRKVPEVMRSVAIALQKKARSLEMDLEEVADD